MIRIRKQDKFPFGVAVMMSKRWAFYINPAAFEKYLCGELLASGEAKPVKITDERG